MQRFHSNHLPEAGYPIIGANSIQFSQADALYTNSSGFLDIASTSSKIQGFSLGDVTMSSTNQTVAKVRPLYAPAYPGVLMVYSTDQDVVQTDLDAYADLGTTTTGVQVLNLSAGATGQFRVLGFDPNNEADNDVAVVEAAEPQYLGFAQS